MVAQCATNICLKCHHKQEEMVFVLWRFRDSQRVWLFFSKLLPEALYASILNTMHREGKGLSFHWRPPFEFPVRRQRNNLAHFYTMPPVGFYEERAMAASDQNFATLMY